MWGSLSCLDFLVRESWQLTAALETGCRQGGLETGVRGRTWEQGALPRAATYRMVISKI